MDVMKIILPIVVSLLIVLPGCATRQDVVDLEKRLESIELEKQEFQEKLTRSLDESGKSRDHKEQQLRTKYAGVNAELMKLHQELRKTNGRLEEGDYTLKRQSSVLDKIGLEMAEIGGRLSQIELYLNMKDKSSRTPSGVTKPGAVWAKQIYKDAREAFGKGELDISRQLFQKLIREHPKSENADNAQFWIGESFFREKWYERAILEYQTVIEKYPQGNKVPAAMLKQGMALLMIGEISSARLILQELRKKFPQSPESKIAARKLKEL